MVPRGSTARPRNRIVRPRARISPAREGARAGRTGRPGCGRRGPRQLVPACHGIAQLPGEDAGAGEAEAALLRWRRRHQPRNKSSACGRGRAPGDGPGAGRRRLERRECLRAGDGQPMVQPIGVGQAQRGAAAPSPPARGRLGRRRPFGVVVVAAGRCWVRGTGLARPTLPGRPPRPAPAPPPRPLVGGPPHGGRRCDWCGVRWSSRHGRPAAQPRLQGVGRGGGFDRGGAAHAVTVPAGGARRAGGRRRGGSHRCPGGRARWCPSGRSCGTPARTACRRGRASRAAPAPDRSPGSRRAENRHAAQAVPVRPRLVDGEVDHRCGEPDMLGVGADQGGAAKASGGEQQQGAVTHAGEIARADLGSRYG